MNLPPAPNAKVPKKKTVLPLRRFFLAAGVSRFICNTILFNYLIYSLRLE